MTVLGFSHYNLRAPRAGLDELLRFYTEVVGLRAGARPPLASFGHWLYAGERPVLHLSETRGAAVPEAGTASAFDHAAFDCTDLPGVETRLRLHGVRYAAVEVPATGQIQLRFADPVGNGIELAFVMSPPPGPRPPRE